MKTQFKQGLRPFQLRVVSYANSYYVERVARLEAALARRPRVLQLDLIGVGEIPADMALLIRSVLRGRAARTEIITVARSSLQGGSVLVWLMGDRRVIREDARVFFRRANLPECDEPAREKPWREDEASEWETSAEVEPEEGDYARVLELINEFLPVRELAGRLVQVPVLRQFGLVENEQVDRFLATAFGPGREPADGAPGGTEIRDAGDGAKFARPRRVRR